MKLKLTFSLLFSTIVLTASAQTANLQLDSLMAKIQDKAISGMLPADL